MSEACRSRRIPALKDLNEVKDHVQTGEDRHVVAVKEIKALVRFKLKDETDLESQRQNESFKSMINDKANAMIVSTDYD